MQTETPQIPKHMRATVDAIESLQSSVATLEEIADGPKANVEKRGPTLPPAGRRSKSRRDRSRQKRARRGGR